MTGLRNAGKLCGPGLDAELLTRLFPQSRLIEILWNCGAYIQGYTPNVWHVWLFASLGAPPVWVLESSWRGRCYQGTWGWMKVHKLMFTDIFRLIVLFGLEVMATHPIWPRLKIRTTQTSSCSSLRALAHNFQAMPRWRTLFFVVSTITYGFKLKDS